ncbi:uncharacterized protein LOC129581724 [Paramacrobiotus metropolitanus]|uniref:uncharacterized protein LOC129581724 n=1 Tax=Paramacrobiotus metropolitanus TaxID=2943436 RepID=UPI0024465C6F|nr:uncharacterized protein LOC129581724 [Paramacrobiotus metropolitanus]
MAVLRSPEIDPTACLLFRVTFYYRLSHSPTFKHSNLKERFYLHVVMEVRGLPFRNNLIWGNEDDYQGKHPNQWHFAEILFERQLNAKFFISLLAYHNDDCLSNIKTIAVDVIRIEYAESVELESGVCPITTAASPISSTASVPVWPAVNTMPTTTTTSTTTAQVGSGISITTELKNATNKETYANDTAYYTQSPHSVLDVIHSAVADSSLEYTGQPTRRWAQENAVNTLLQITDQIIRAEESGNLQAPPLSKDGHAAAATIYQALEHMYHTLPPQEDLYVFNNSFSRVYVSAVLIDGSSQFESLSLTSQLEVSGFDPKGNIFFLGDSSSSVASIAFKKEVLKEVFEDLRQSANETRVRFVLSLSAMLSFKFAKFIPQNELRERSSPIILLASMNHRPKRKDTVIIRHNVDVLFEHPSGAKRQHQCIFLNYTSKQWSGDECRIFAKSAKWDSTTVECACNHFTPFSLLLTLCGSLSRSFIPKDKSLTLDLAVVTTATTIVSAACCLVALLIIVVRIWRRSVICDKVTFTRMGLWIALLGMYLFIVFSQLVVYAPELCGQKFCLRFKQFNLFKSYCIRNDTGEEITSQETHTMDLE